MIHNPIDKIKKLLRLSKSPNPHEAELAMERAFEIAAQHQIDIATLDLGEEENRIVREACRCGQRLSLSRKLAMSIAASFFNCTPVISRPDVVWFGTKTDIEMGKYVVEFLVSTCDAFTEQTRREYRHRFTENRRRNLVFGFFYGISSKLGKAKEQACLVENQLALVLRNNEKARDDAKAQWFPNTVRSSAAQPRRRDPDWLVMGYEKGQSTEINRPLTGQHQPGAAIA